MTVCTPNRRQLAVFDFETSNSLVFARILPPANQLIGVKYSETLLIPLLLMKRPPLPAELRTQSTHRSLPLRRAQNYKLRKSRGPQLNPEGFQTQTLKHCEAFGCLGLGSCKTLLLNQILEVLSCLVPLAYELEFGKSVQQVAKICFITAEPCRAGIRIEKDWGSKWLLVITDGKWSLWRVIINSKK